MRKRRIIAFVVILAVLALAATPNPAPIGELVDVGGRKLHIHCTGTGNPAVIVENGGAAFSFDWELVQPDVAQFSRICTYDRAGYAWSDRGPDLTRSTNRHATFIVYSRMQVCPAHMCWLGIH